MPLFKSSLFCLKKKKSRKRLWSLTINLLVISGWQGFSDIFFSNNKSMKLVLLFFICILFFVLTGISIVKYSIPKQKNKLKYVRNRLLAIEGEGRKLLFFLVFIWKYLSHCDVYFKYCSTQNQRSSKTQCGYSMLFL